MVEYPTIRIRPPEDPLPLLDALRSWGEYDWVVFTSVNGVRHAREALEGDGGPTEPPPGPRLAAIGPSTARELGAWAGPVEVVPGEYRAEALARALRETGSLAGRRVLLPRAADAREVLARELESAGARVDEIAAYETEPGRPEVDSLGPRMRSGEIDWLTFTASSTVRNFVRMAGDDVGRARVAVIGPVTADTARRQGLPVHAVAREYTIPGLVGALVEAEEAREG